MEQTETYTAPFTLPVGDYQLTLTAYAVAGGSGSVLARGNQNITLTTEGTLPDVAMTGTVASVNVAAGQTLGVGERRALQAHPCHQCPDREDHARWAERWWRLKRETVGLQRKVEGRTNSVARTFDRICTLLGEMGYLSDSGDLVTAQGENLRRLYTEKDLLAAECLRLGVWKRLDPAGLASVVSALIHEPRRDETDPSPRMPNEDVAEAAREMNRLWSELEDRERELGLPLLALFGVVATLLVPVFWSF